MIPYPHRRVHARLTLDASYTATFLHAGRVFPSQPMTSLSAGGLGLRVPAAVTAGMEVGDEVTGIRLEHPDLLQMELQGSITHLLSQRHGPGEGFMLLGIRFEGAPPGLIQFLEAFVAQRLGT